VTQNCWSWQYAQARAWITSIERGGLCGVWNEEGGGESLKSDISFKMTMVFALGVPQRRNGVRTTVYQMNTPWCWVIIARTMFRPIRDQ
jgi:hypothetical protein